MTRLYLDTEFNGFDGQLISLALYEPLTGKSFYEVLTPPRRIDPWVHENVIPWLGKRPVRVEDLQRDLREFLAIWTDVEVVADWPADFQHFFWALTIEGHWHVDQPIRTALMESGQLESERPHNALSDAKALAVWYVGNRHLDRIA